MSDPRDEVVHLAPVWREHADFIIAAVLPAEATTEQLWARRIDAYRFTICCIPFFVYDLALGDVVETDRDYLIRRVVEPSGRFVFRVCCNLTLGSPSTGERRVIVTVIAASVLAIIFMYLLLTVAFSGWGDPPPSGSVSPSQPRASLAIIDFSSDITGR